MLVFVLCLLSIAVKPTTQGELGYVESGLSVKHWNWYKIRWNDKLAQTAADIRDRQLAMSASLHLTEEEGGHDTNSYLPGERWLLQIVRQPVLVKHFADQYMATKKRILGYLIERGVMKSPEVGCATDWMSGEWGKIYCLYKF